MSTQTPVAPGWYPDPYGEAQRRYWDGTRWTPHLDGQAPAPAVPQPPAPAQAETVFEAPIATPVQPPSPPAQPPAMPAMPQVGANAGPNGPVIITPGPPGAAGIPPATPYGAPPVAPPRKSRTLPVVISLVVVAAIGAVVAVVLLASGGSSKAADEKAIRNTIATFISTNDGSLACAQLAPSLLAKTTDCANRFDGEGFGTLASDRAGVRNIKIDGDKATATETRTDAGGRYALVKLNGDWKISDAPFAHN